MLSHPATHHVEMCFSFRTKQGTKKGSLILVVFVWFVSCFVLFFPAIDTMFKPVIMSLAGKRMLSGEEYRSSYTDHVHKFMLSASRHVSLVETTLPILCPSLSTTPFVFWTFGWRRHLQYHDNFPNLQKECWYWGNNSAEGLDEMPLYFFNILQCSSFLKHHPGNASRELMLGFALC